MATVPPDGRTDDDISETIRLGRALSRSGDLASAERLAANILKSKPEHFDALHLLAAISLRRGAREESIELLDRALATNPDSAMAWTTRGVALIGLGRHVEALTSLSRSLALDPMHSPALVHRGGCLFALARYEEAFQSFDRALDIEPLDFRALYGRAKAKHMLRRLEDALADYERASAIRPRHVEALVNLGIVLEGLGRFDEAIVRYERVLALRPWHVQALVGRGNALHAIGRFEMAIGSFEQALAVAPDHALALGGMGVALQKLNRLTEAIACLDRVVALTPNNTGILINRGNALYCLLRHEEAITNYESALALEPGNVNALYNRGLALKELNRFDQAIESFDKALAVDPDHIGANLQRGVALLCSGDFGQGWRSFEWRWKTEALERGSELFSVPRWFGDADLAGKTILLHAERGFGDTLQFVRFAPQVAARGAIVLLWVEERLKPLVAGMQGVAQTFGATEKLPAFDYYCPLLSLPLALGTTLDTVPAHVPYLFAPASRLEKWSTRIGSGGKLKVGLAWSGNVRHKHSRLDNRPIPLKMLLPLVSMTGIAWYSLQKELTSEDAALLRQRPEVEHLGNELRDFGDTAAVVSKLDLVVSIDTSVAHLAGALGRPVWVLTPYSRDWRWHPGSGRSLWYPTARVFRQSKPGEWQGVLAQIARELATFVRRKDP